MGCCICGSFVFWDYGHRCQGMRQVSSFGVSRLGARENSLQLALEGVASLNVESAIMFQGPCPN